MSANPQLRHEPLDRIAARALPAADMVTVVIEHKPLPARVDEYEAWLARIIPIAGRFPGHRGVQVIRPSHPGGGYTVMLRFDALDAAQDWMLSDARRNLMNEAAPLLPGGEAIRTVTGIEFWFTAAPASSRVAPRWKQFLVALSVIYPLTLAVPWLLAPVLLWLGTHGAGLAAHLLDVGTVVLLMTYVVMPRYTRRIAAWLYR